MPSQKPIEISTNSANYLMRKCGCHMDFEPEGRSFPDENVLVVGGLLRVRFFCGGRLLTAEKAYDWICSMSCASHDEMEQL